MTAAQPHSVPTEMAAVTSYETIFLPGTHSTYTSNRVKDIYSFPNSLSLFLDILSECIKHHC